MTPRTSTSIFRHNSRKPSRLTFAAAGVTVAAAAAVATGIALAGPASASAWAGPTAGHSQEAAAIRHADAGSLTSAGSRLVLTRQHNGSLTAAPVHSGHAGRPAAQARAAGTAGAHNVLAGISRHQPAAPAGKVAAPDRNRVAPQASGPTGVCHSSQLHWWICHAELVMEQHGTPRSLISTSAAYIVTMHESGGNPHASNGWDSNAAAGTPSEGIAQVTRPTFDAYSLPGHRDIWNPVDNMIAAFRYAIAKYGSMGSIPGVVAVHNGGSYVGY